MSGRTVKERLKWGFSFLTFPILAGPLKGKIWTICSGGNFILGKYETAKTQAVVQITQENDVILDVGAHVGYYTMLFSTLAGSSGRVYSFEPRDINLAFLKKHLKSNDCRNIEIWENCVGDCTEEAYFDTRTGTGTGRLSSTGDTKVSMVSLDELVFSGKIPKPDIIKMDVEGAEMRVLNGAKRVIQTYHPRMIVATHGEKLHHQCCEFLTENGYELTHIDQAKGDREMIAMPVLKKG